MPLSLRASVIYSKFPKIKKPPFYTRQAYVVVESQAYFVYAGIAQADVDAAGNRGVICDRFGFCWIADIG